MRNHISSSGESGVTVSGMTFRTVAVMTLFTNSSKLQVEYLVLLVPGTPTTYVLASRAYYNYDWLLLLRLYLKIDLR